MAGGMTNKTSIANPSQVARFSGSSLKAQSANRNLTGSMKTPAPRLPVPPPIALAASARVRVRSIFPVAL
jgi:hypothetical protein